MSDLILKDKLYRTDVFNSVFKADKRGSAYNFYREAIFIRMLVLCADGFKFVNAAQLSRFSTANESQCNLVWAACVEHNVLRHKDGYYSALEWMVENGFVGDTSKPVEQPQPKPQPTSQILRHTESNDGKSVSEALRPNVRMNRDQIQDILTHLSQDEFALGLDMLSDWKANKVEVTCNNDYYQFKKWVIKAVKKEMAERKKNVEKTDEYYEEWAGIICAER